MYKQTGDVMHSRPRYFYAFIQEPLIKQRFPVFRRPGVKAHVQLFLRHLFLRQRGGQFIPAKVSAFGGFQIGNKRPSSAWQSTKIFTTP